MTAIPFTLIAGPCVIENRDLVLQVAEQVKTITDRLGIRYVFKASFDKANRSSGKSFRGPGPDEGLKILQEVGQSFGVPVLTDIHESHQAAAAAQAVDVLQIPAFLCRQSDLLEAAAQAVAGSNKVVNVKKGQFLAPWDMKNVADKLASTGNEKIMLCDRGTSFGYNTLVSDFRGLPIMAQTGWPVVFDATHSVQQPGGNGATSGGQREFAPVLARAAVAVGVAGLFIEAHDDPDNPPSDGPNMLPLDWMDPVLAKLRALDDIAKAQ